MARIHKFESNRMEEFKEEFPNLVEEDFDSVKISKFTESESTFCDDDSSIRLGWDFNNFYFKYQKEDSGFRSNYAYMKVPLDRVILGDLIVTKEKNKTLKNLLSITVPDTTDVSQLFVNLPFKHPETGEREEIEFVLKEEEWMKPFRRFIRKIRKRMKKEEKDKNSEDPLKVLKTRFAKGEISEEEFIKKKELLK